MTQLPTGAFGPYSDTIKFIIELDKLKRIYRKNNVLDNSRRENSAEHSWHFAIAAMSFQPYAGDIDIGHAIQLALVHDVVEIDAGDVMVYDIAARKAVAEQEKLAAKRIFGLLPSPQHEYFLNLWQEYDEAKTAESQFANILDRAMPMLMNLHNEGQSWVENNIRLEQVIERNLFIEKQWPEFWQYLYAQLLEAQKKGWLK
ncbi:HD domain-containing protein [Proteus myxofaciens]|uniref:HAD superfamily hydrolase n=1 Tax=Proteus myxofaciens ATCC 19692 TaxID=1354337 RepID=A0A198GCY3_9GAMM|nr:HD domain-containing protein [Proteus myxofaciens]OAT34953.1 HAD superfamily hydrolase [Proteus myxofaciens ATCC 19692]